MSTPQPEPARILAALETLPREVSRLGDRVAALESAGASAPRAAEAPARVEELSEDLVMVIAAAVAGFLGKRAHVRQIRLIGSTAWAQQGRVTIQASHTVPVQHG